MTYILLMEFNNKNLCFVQETKELIENVNVRNIKHYNKWENHSYSSEQEYLDKKEKIISLINKYYSEEFKNIIRKIVDSVQHKGVSFELMKGTKRFLNFFSYKEKFNPIISLFSKKEYVDLIISYDLSLEPNKLNPIYENQEFNSHVVLDAYIGSIDPQTGLEKAQYGTAVKAKSVSISIKDNQIEFLNKEKFWHLKNILDVIQFYDNFYS